MVQGPGKLLYFHWYFVCLYNERDSKRSVYVTRAVTIKTLTIQRGKKQSVSWSIFREMFWDKLKESHETSWTIRNLIFGIVSEH